MPRHRTNAEAGFTLLEMVTTTALVAIVYAIAMPRFSAMSTPFAARQAAQQIASAFQSARMRAIATNSSHRFTYDSATRVYTLERLNGGSWVTESSDQLPTGVTITAPGTTPTIDSRGMLNGTYTIPVTAGYSSRTVTINVLGKTTIS